jgi:ketosteroid isomerase-like protein
LNSHLEIQERYAKLTRAGDVPGSAALFAPGAVIWHNYDDRAVSADKAVRALARLHRSMPDARWEDVNVLATAEGFVWQAVLAGHAAGGEVRAHTCMVATVDESGLIARLDEYLDPAAVAPLAAAP